MTLNVEYGGKRSALIPALALIALLAVASGPIPGAAQSSVPRDQIHLSLALGGHIHLGIGYTHWIEEHHALEVTAFPVLFPFSDFHFALRGGYSWIPSDEVWRAKLGGNFTVLIRPKREGVNQFTPFLALTPGVQYDPDSDRSFRTDLWVSYYLREKIFAPTALEFIYLWPR
jgi:hypothetical protein